MSEQFIFWASVLLMLALFTLLMWLFFQVKYQYSVRLDKDKALLYYIRYVVEVYNDREIDRLKEAIENGDFKDDRCN